MSFLDKLLDFAGDILDSYQLSQVYPTLQDALHKYLHAEEYALIECTPFAAKIEKQGVLSVKTVTLTVRDDGSVYIVESGLLGEKTVFPKRAGAPTPQQFQQMLEGEEEEEENVVRTLFLMLGKMAKADSRVSQKEIDVIEEIITNIGFDQETRKVAIEFFNEGKVTRTPFREIATELARQAEDVEMRQDALHSLVEIAIADGDLHTIEKRYLNEAVAAFGLPPSMLTEALEEKFPDLQKYYELLGCEPSVSDAELTKCYRDLSRQYHPDVISSKNLAPDFIKFANEKFQEIQNAYEIITKHRKS